jgi:hypothetical protein
MDMLSMASPNTNRSNNARTQVMFKTVGGFNANYLQQISELNETHSDCRSYRSARSRAFTAASKKALSHKSGRSGFSSKRTLSPGAVDFGFETRVDLGYEKFMMKMIDRKARRSTDTIFTKYTPHEIKKMYKAMLKRKRKA